MPPDCHALIILCLCSSIPSQRKDDISLLAHASIIVGPFSSTSFSLPSRHSHLLSRCCAILLGECNFHNQSSSRPNTILLNFLRKSMAPMNQILRDFQEMQFSVPAAIAALSMFFLFSVKASIFAKKNAFSKLIYVSGNGGDGILSVFCVCFHDVCGYLI